MLTILNTFSSGHNDRVIYFLFIFAVLRVLFEVFGVLSVKLKKHVGWWESQKRLKIHRLGLFLALGFIFLHIPEIFFS